jgi:hypothetical protein
LGLAVREVFSFWTGHPYDFEIWVRLGYYVSMGRDPYSTSLPPIRGLSMPGLDPLPSIGYPPLWAFMQAAVYRIYTSIGIDNRFLYYFLIKQETIIGDVVAAILIYKIIRRRCSQEDATAAFAFWMLCPITIILSSIWGMFDQLALALVLLSFLTLSSTTRSSVSEGVGILLKAIPVLFLPGLALGQRSTQRRFAFLSIGILVPIVLSLAPYLLFHSWSISRILATGLSTVNKVTNSVNFWVVIYVWSQYGSVPLPVVQVVTWLGYAWIVGVLAVYAFCFFKIGRERVTERYLLVVLLFATVAFYLTRINVNEQYVVYFLGLGLVDRYWNGPKRKRLFNAVWLTTLVFLVFNNTYFTRFLSPLSLYYYYLNDVIVSGLSGDIRFGAMVVCGFAFSLLCALYLRSLYFDIRAHKHGQATILSD